MKIRRLLLFFILMSIVFATASCQVSTDAHTGYTAFRKSAFRAELRGTLFGIEFGAVIENSGGGATLTYLRPDALSGITLHKSAEGVYIDHGGEPTRVIDDRLTGLLSPLEILTAECETLRIQKKDASYVLSLPNGGALTLTAERIPTEYTSPDLCFTVVWWESTANGS